MKEQLLPNGRRMNSLIRKLPQLIIGYGRAGAVKLLNNRPTNRRSDLKVANKVAITQPKKIDYESGTELFSAQLT